MDITIFSKSSSHPESPYGVKFTSKNNRLQVHCSCPAGIHGQLCKHKTAFIIGDSKMLYEQSQRVLLNDVASIISTSSLKNDCFNFLQRKKEIEASQQALKKELKAIKSDLATKLKNGIEL